jgi:hypothetical protein
MIYDIGHDTQRDTIMHFLSGDLQPGLGPFS